MDLTDYNMMAFWAFVLMSASGQDPLPFGTVLGNYQGVIGYSNFGSEKNGIDYEYANYVDGIFTGLQYECVEFARRFLVLKKNLTFASLPCASDIWHLDLLFDINTEHPLPLKRIQNGSQCKPNEGDILIYRRNSIAPFGHVAIITEVSKDSIKIAEQNWDNAIWPGDYSRSLKVVYRNKEMFILDKEFAVIGWMVYNPLKHQESCFDLSCSSCTPADASKFCNYL